MTTLSKPRKLANRANSVSVTDYGVAGDGTTDDTIALAAAIVAADTAGKWLVWPEGTYKITSGITETISQLRWICNGAVINYVGSDDIYGVHITVDDNKDHAIKGVGLKIVANGNLHGGMQILQPLGTQTANIHLENVGAEEIEMYATPGIGSFGLSVRGGFGVVQLDNCYANDIMMRTGAGVSGSRGVTGILVRNHYGTAGAYAKHIELNSPRVNRVYNQDATYTFDMDGIGIFANPSDFTHGPSHAVVNNPYSKGCWGRDIKFQIYSGCTNNPTSIRDEGPTGGINHPAYDYQSGSGSHNGGSYLIDGIISRYLVGFQISAEGSPSVSKWTGGNVVLTNAGTIVAGTGILLIDALTTGAKIAGMASGITVNGVVSNFGKVRTNQFDADILRLDTITCTELTECLVRVEAKSGGTAPYRAIIHTRDCINLGPERPTVFCNISGVSSRALLNDTGGTGFGPLSRRYVSSATSLTGLKLEDSHIMPTPLNGSSGFSSGSEKLYSVYLENGASQVLPIHGYNNIYLAEIIMGRSNQTFAKVCVASTSLVSIDVGTLASVGNAEVDPGSGDLRVWKSTDPSVALVVSNESGSGRDVLIKFFG